MAPWPEAPQVPLEPPDQKHWEAASGYVQLGMYLEADAELDEIDPFCRAVPEVLAVRLEIYAGLQKWELMQAVAKKLAGHDPQTSSARFHGRMRRGEQNPSRQRKRF